MICKFETKREAFDWLKKNNYQLDKRLMRYKTKTMIAKFGWDRWNNVILTTTKGS